MGAAGGPPTPALALPWGCFSLRRGSPSPGLARQQTNARSVGSFTPTLVGSPGAGQELPSQGIWTSSILVGMAGAYRAYCPACPPAGGPCLALSDGVAWHCCTANPPSPSAAAMAGDRLACWALQGQSHDTQGTRLVGFSRVHPHRVAESPLVLVSPVVGDACTVAKEHV